MIGLLKIELAAAARLPGFAAVVVAGFLPVTADNTLPAMGAALVKNDPICDRKDGLTLLVPLLLVITGLVACAAGRFTPALVSNVEARLP
jgi:hypothetical protein